MNLIHWQTTKKKKKTQQNGMESFKCRRRLYVVFVIQLKMNCFVYIFFAIFYGFGLCHRHVWNSIWNWFRKKKKIDSNLFRLYTQLFWSTQIYVPKKLQFLVFLGVFFFQGQWIGWWRRCGLIGCCKSQSITCRSRSSVLFAQQRNSFRIVESYNWSSSSNDNWQQQQSIVFII